MPRCPYCGSRNTRRRYGYHRRRKWRCRRCNRPFRRRYYGVWSLLFAIVIISVGVYTALWWLNGQGIIEIENLPAPPASINLAPSDAPDSSADTQPILALKVPSATPVPVAVSKLLTTPVAILSSTPMSDPTRVPTPIVTPTPKPTSTPVPPPHLRHIEEKYYMLELINEQRARVDLDPVVLGDNIAAQLHADAALKNCFASHWGIDGLKPYMRYSLAGGYQANGENGHGSDYCIKASDWYRAIESIDSEIRDAMSGWMSSPGHRRNILGKWHKKVNIGLAWDKYNFLAYQHFEGDYVEYDELPSIQDGILSLSGIAKNGARFGSRRTDLL